MNAVQEQGLLSGTVEPQKKGILRELEVIHSELRNPSKVYSFLPGNRFDTARGRDDTSRIGRIELIPPVSRMLTDKNNLAPFLHHK